MSHPPASSEDELTGLRPKNNPLGAAGGWASLSLRHHQRQHSRARVPKPICTPVLAPNPSGTQWLCYGIRGTTGLAKEVSKALEQLPSSCLPICSSSGKWAPQQGGLGSGPPLWSAPGVMHQVWGATAVLGGWNFWGCGPGLSSVRMMPQARAVGSSECPCPMMPVPCGD